MYRIAVTNRHLCRGDYLDRIRAIASGDTYDAILLREKDLSETEYYTLAKQVLEITGKYDKKCILHTYHNVAISLHNPYLHMPLSVWESMSAMEQAQLDLHMTSVGTSVHSLAQLASAESIGADYVIAGHIYETGCKPGLEARGLDFLQDICKQAAVPVYAIGGIDKSREVEVVERGAKGVCMMSGCMSP